MMTPDDVLDEVGAEKVWELGGEVILGGEAK
jgi:hypothetical protein